MQHGFIFIHTKILNDISAINGEVHLDDRKNQAVEQDHQGERYVNYCFRHLNAKVRIYLFKCTLFAKLKLLHGLMILIIISALKFA